jgi:hypothetical protein
MLGILGSLCLFYVAIHEFFNAQASQTIIFVLQMLDILDSFFSMYIVYSCIKVQRYLIFPRTLSIFLCTCTIRMLPMWYQLQFSLKCGDQKI